MTKHPKFEFEMKTYWDTFEGKYQHGEQKHRLYLLDWLKRLGIKSLLDVGCGTGPIYELLISAKEGRWDNIIRYKGTDYSQAMIEIAEGEFPNGDFEVQDARKMTEPSNNYDCVLLMHVLDHLDDYRAAIKEAARVSNKFVMIVLWRSFVNEGTNLNDRNMYGKEEGDEPWEDTHLQEYSKAALDEAFKEANLRVIETIEGEQVNDLGRYNFIYLLSK